MLAPYIADLVSIEIADIFSVIFLWREQGHLIIVVLEAAGRRS
jgi:hypothetical protein